MMGVEPPPTTISCNLGASHLQTSMSLPQSIKQGGITATSLDCPKNKTERGSSWAPVNVLKRCWADVRVATNSPRSALSGTLEVYLLPWVFRKCPEINSS